MCWGRDRWSIAVSQNSRMLGDPLVQRLSLGRPAKDFSLSLPLSHCLASFWPCICSPLPLPSGPPLVGTTAEAGSCGAGSLHSTLSLSVCKRETWRRRVEGTSWHLGMGPKSTGGGNQGEDLLRPLLTVRPFLEEPGHWGCGPGQLNTRRAKALGVFVLLPRPLLNSPPAFPGTIQWNLSSSEAGTPLTLTLHHSPDPGRQRLPLAHLCRSHHDGEQAGGGSGGGAFLHPSPLTSHPQCPVTLGPCQLYWENFLLGSEEPLS